MGGLIFNDIKPPYFFGGSMHLIQGNYYWILDDYDLPLKLTCDVFNKLKWSKLVYRLTENSCERYYFKNENSIQFVSVFEFDIPKLLYFSLDDYLVSLIKRINDLKYITFEIDESFKEKIKESQEKNPEKWI